MSPQKPYTTSWAVHGPDGCPMLCELTLTPIGSYATNPGSSLTQAVHSFMVVYPIIGKGVESDSSPKNQAKEQ